MVTAPAYLGRGVCNCLVEPFQEVDLLVIAVRADAPDPARQVLDRNEPERVE